MYPIISPIFTLVKHETMRYMLLCLISYEKSRLYSTTNYSFIDN